MKDIVSCMEASAMSKVFSPGGGGAKHKMGNSDDGFCCWNCKIVCAALYQTGLDEEIRYLGSLR